MVIVSKRLVCRLDRTEAAQLAAYANKTGCQTVSEAVRGCFRAAFRLEGVDHVEPGEPKVETPLFDVAPAERINVVEVEEPPEKKKRTRPKKAAEGETKKPRKNKLSDKKKGAA